MTLEEMKLERDRLDEKIKEAEAQQPIFFDGLTALKHVFEGRVCCVANDPRLANFWFSNDVLAQALLFGVWRLND